jgi:membrane protease YdiL (CAAX protease family)
MSGRPSDPDSLAAPQRTPTARAESWSIGYALIAYALSWLVIGAVSLGLWIPVHGLGALSIDAAWLATLIPLYRSGRLGWRDLGFRGISPLRATGLVAGTLILYGWVTAYWEDAVSVRHIRNPFAGINHHSTVVIVLVGLSAVMSPVVEEVFFRGFLYRCFRNRLTVAPASLLVGLMFGLIHTQYPLAVALDVAFGGVLLCLLYEYTGSLLPCIAVDLYLDVGGFVRELTGVAYSYVTEAFLAAALIVILLSHLRSHAFARSTG